MRAYLNGDSRSADFARDLLALGEGKMPSDTQGFVQMDQLATTVESPDELMNAVFYNLSTNFADADWLAGRAILAPKNCTVDSINLKLLDCIPGQCHVYKSIDRTSDPSELAEYPIEVLNSLQPSGLPPHILRLKVGAPIMLIRNLLPPKQCNGTRLIIKSLSLNLIEATIATGCGKGEVVLIPRMHLLPSDASIPINFRRSQFPVKLCFAMSINKSQGQTLSIAGLHLREQCFSHGQLYVGCSRVGSKDRVFIYSPNNCARNITYTEVL